MRERQEGAQGDANEDGGSNSGNDDDDDIDNAMAHPDAEADEQDRQEGGATLAAPYRDLNHPHLPGQARLVREVSIA